MPFGKYTLEEVREKQDKKLSSFDIVEKRRRKWEADIQKAILKEATRSNRMPVAKSKPRKVRTSRKKLEDKIWELCKQIIRKRHGDTCYTCGARGLEGSNWQTGHGKPKGALPLRYKYDLRNLRPQCMKDNLHYGGLSDIFIAKLEREPEGLAFLEEACEKTDGTWRIKQGNTMGGKDATIFLENLYEEYKALI